MTRFSAYVASRLRGAIAGAGAHAALSVMVKVAVLTLGVRVFTFIREMLMARAFGVGDIVDAFVIAYLFPTLLISILAASLNVSLMPVFMSVRREFGDLAAGKLLANVTFPILGLLIAISTILGVAFPSLLELLGSHLPPEKSALIYRLSLLLLPTIPLGGLSTIWGAVLNANNRFSLAASTPALSPLGAGVSLVLFGERYGVYALASGALIGQMSEALILAIAVRREGFTPVPRWRGLDDATRQVLSQYAPMVAGAMLMSGTNFVDQSMAALLPAGSVAALSLGGKISTLVIVLGSTAAGTAALPHFSRLAAEKDHLGIRKSLAGYLRLSFLVSVPLTGALLLGSRPIVSFVFERGAFTHQNTVVVAHVLTMYALQIPFYIGGIVLMRLLSSIGRNRQLLWLSLLNFITNVVLNIVLMREFGVAGLALSTSIVIMIWFICCWVTVHSRLSSLKYAT